jgi:hypothetical protein
VDVQELAPGLWRWTARHPAWVEGDDWEPDVACFYAETSAATLLVDPLVPEEERERFLRHLDADVGRRGLPVAIGLTGEWHRRSSEELAARYGASVHVGPGNAPPGAEARAAGPDPALWVPELRALAVGDGLISVGGELRLWGARKHPDEVRALLELPVDHVLVAHGDHLPGGRALIEAALEAAPYD